MNTSENLFNHQTIIQVVDLMIDGPHNIPKIADLYRQADSATIMAMYTIATSTFGTTLPSSQEYLIKLHAAVKDVLLEKCLNDYFKNPGIQRFNSKCRSEWTIEDCTVYDTQRYRLLIRYPTMQK